MQAALVTPFVSHLPLHPSSYLGYGASILRKNFEVDIIDLNAQIYFGNRHKLNQLLNDIDNTNIVVDSTHLHPFYFEVSAGVEAVYDSVAWEKYHSVYITAPSWFLTVSTEDVLKLSTIIKKK